jgi:hypothetical protein
MAIPPTARAMSLCDYLIREERTRKVSLIGTFWSIAVVDGFPVRPLPFTVVVLLIDGLGEIELTLEVSREDGIESVELFTHSATVHFTDRFQPVYYSMRLMNIEFPEPGHYHFVLTSSDRELARTRIQVYAKETE